MKRFTITLLVALIATAATAQKNNLFWTMRVNVKMDKKLEWEKKATAFMKTHYPQYKFRVYETMTGDNSGSYVIAVGPLAYGDLDQPPVFPKGEAALKSDAQALDGICESTEVRHFRRIEDISRMNAERKLKYISISEVEFTIGSWTNVKAFQAKIKEARDKGGSKMDIDVFRPSLSGVLNQMAMVTYFEKLGEIDREEDLEEMYDKVHGKNAWYKDLQAYLATLKSVKTELRMLREDLSSPNPVNVAATKN